MADVFASKFSDDANRDASSDVSTPSGFIGRGEALERLQKAARAAINGHGSLMLISGEPGIGKTRLAEELARNSEDQGVLVLWGRCFEQPGAPPYWPWVQLMRECAAAQSDDQLRAMLKSRLSIVAALVPEIGERLGFDAARPEESDSRDNRFVLFDAVAGFFAAAASNVPLVLVLDDLHWADESSLTLLEFVAKGLKSERICIICMYRDVEVTRKSPLLSTLGELARSNDTLRIRLSGLSLDETEAMTASITGLRLQCDVTRSIFEHTDGNPFFVSEVARLIADVHRSTQGPVYAVDVPDGVREAIGRRLSSLSKEANRLLAIAAVLGRDFDIRVVARATAKPLEHCLSVLDGAIQAGIVHVENEDSPTAWRFSHALIRETLYEEVATLERLQLHKHLAEALLDVHVDNVDAVLSELAHHFCEASALGEYQTAANYALRAAERDERLLAYEEAIRHYTELVTVMSAKSRGDDRLVARALYRIGYLCIPLGRLDVSFDHLMRAIQLARSHDDIELFARCAAALVQLTSDSSQSRTAPVLEEALKLLPQKDQRHRAIVLAHLAFALRAAGQPERVTATGEQAIALARESGDSAVLAIALRFVIMGMRGDPETLDRRLSYGRELAALADSVDDIGERSECLYWQLLNLLEAGEVDEFDDVLEPFARLAERHQLLHHGFSAQLLGTARRLMQGQWSGLEERIESTLKNGHRSRREDAEGVYGAQMFQLNRDLGRLRTIAPLVKRMVDDPDARLWAPGTMLMCCEVGLLDEARQRFEKMAVDNFSGVARDDLWITCMVFCAETCATLGDAARAKTLYKLLLPYAEQAACHAQAICFGSAAVYLGMLAETMGTSDVARSHYEFAISKNRAMQAWPALARCQLRYGRLLLDSESADDRNAGRQLLIDAEELAARFEMRGLADDIDALRADAPARLPDDLTAREVEVLQLLAFGRSNKDISKALSISLSTVATHVRNIFSKTGCANRTEAAAYARQHALD